MCRTEGWVCKLAQCLSAARDSTAISATTADCCSKMNDALLLGIVVCFFVVAVLFLVTLNRW